MILISMKIYGINPKFMKALKYIITLTFVVITGLSFGQRPQGQQFDREKYESARVAFITNRLDLKPEQAEKFWPLYNKHNEEKESLMRKMSEINKESEGNISESKAKQLIDRKFDVQKSMLNLDQKFMNDITKVISNRQALALGGANRDFIRQLYRMNQQRGGN